MSPRATVPLTRDVIAALAMFFHGGDGPSHSTISRVLIGAGFGDGYVYNPNVQGPNKEQRVLQGLRAVQRQPARARDLVEELLSALRVAGLIGGVASGDDVDRLRRALASAGWYLTEDGHLQPFGHVDLDTGGRPALEEQVERLRRSTTDPDLQIGTAKELLESVSKFVLEELGMPVNEKMDFNQLWHLARERLNVLPQQVDPTCLGPMRSVRSTSRPGTSPTRSTNSATSKAPGTAAPCRRGSPKTSPCSWFVRRPLSPSTCSRASTARRADMRIRRALR